MARNPVQFQKGISLNEFLSLYGTEQQCFDALYRWRWPNGFVCPNCGHDRGCQLTTHKLQQCYRCNRQTSITAGTIFEATKLPLTVWFQGIYFMTQDKKGASAMKLHRQLGISYNAAWRMRHKLMQVMMERDRAHPLGGFIQLDDAYLDPEAALRIETASNHGVHLHKVLSDDGQEVRLYCFSEERAAKERGIVERFARRFETALTELCEGLSRPRTQKRLDKVWQRIGRLKEKSRGIAQHYDIELDTDESGERATAVRFTRLRATLVAHGLGRHIVARGRFVHPEPGEQVELRLVVEVEALLRLLPEELALEPVELVLERVVVGLQLLKRRLRLREPGIRIAERNAKPRVLLLEFGNVGCRQRQALFCIEHNGNLSTFESFRQPSDSVSSGVESLYPRLPPVPVARCDSAPVSPPSLPGPEQTGPAPGACSISNTRPCRTQES